MLSKPAQIVISSQNKLAPKAAKSRASGSKILGRSRHESNIRIKQESKSSSMRSRRKRELKDENIIENLIDINTRIRKPRIISDEILIKNPIQLPTSLKAETKTRKRRSDCSNASTLKLKIKKEKL